MDAAFAVMCLVMLAVLLPLAAEAFDAFEPDAPILWREAVATAREGPFGAGLLVTGMLATTLAPTAIHLFDGLRGMLLAPSKGHRAVAAELRAWPDEAPFDDVPLEERAVRAIQRHQARWLLSGLAVPGFMLGGAGLLRTGASGMGALLAEVALAAPDLLLAARVP